VRLEGVEKTAAALDELNETLIGAVLAFSPFHRAHCASGAEESERQSAEKSSTHLALLSGRSTRYLTPNSSSRDRSTSRTPVGGRELDAVRKELALVKKLLLSVVSFAESGTQENRNAFVSLADQLRNL